LSTISKRIYQTITGFLIVVAVITLSIQSAEAQQVGKWRRYVISLTDSLYSGNPFLLEIEATFTHTQSGMEVVVPGYYAGSHTWQIAFMPLKIGEWTYKTFSLNEDVSNKTGTLTCVSSRHPGMLKADSAHPKKWKYVDGPYVVPIGLFIQIMLENASSSEFMQCADFMKTNNIQLINFRLSENDKAFSSISNLHMDTARWDRLDERMEILTERGIGIDVMLYTDDSGKPSFGAYSDAEKLLIRYMVARLASYPVVMFNTGIDISEYRDQAWVNWYGKQVRKLDPYNHPVSSRYSGGSGNIVMNGQTYNSIGGRNSKLSELLEAFNTQNVPSANNDNFGEQKTDINGHTPSDIRRTAWKAVISGGVAFHIRHNQKSCPDNTTECDMPFSINNVAQQLDSEQWLRLVNPFLQTKLADIYGEMVPAPKLVSNSYALANQLRTRLLYFIIGVNDTWDNGGGDITLKLSSLSTDYSGVWFDPRTGDESNAGSFNGGQDYTVAPPNEDDWILLLTPD